MGPSPLCNSLKITLKPKEDAEVYSKSLNKNSNPDYFPLTRFNNWIFDIPDSAGMVESQFGFRITNILIIRMSRIMTQNFYYPTH